MKTDLYTKTVLTVIAVALSINLLTDFDIITKAYANDSSQDAVNVRLVEIGPFVGNLGIDLRQIGGRNVASNANERTGHAFLLVDDASKYVGYPGYEGDE